MCPREVLGHRWWRSTSQLSTFHNRPVLPYRCCSSACPGGSPEALEPAGRCSRCAWKDRRPTVRCFFAKMRNVGFNDYSKREMYTLPQLIWPTSWNKQRPSPRLQPPPLEWGCRPRSAPCEGLCFYLRTQFINTITIRAFSRRFYPKRLTSVNTHIDTPTAESTMQGDSQLVRSS